MSGTPQKMAGQVGDVVTVIVPNWASAGFAWHPEFEPRELHLVAKATAGRDPDRPRDLAFSFKLMAAEANLRLVLRRRGAPPRETREYVIGSGASRR